MVCKQLGQQGFDSGGMGYPLKCNQDTSEGDRVRVTNRTEPLRVFDVYKNVLDSSNPRVKTGWNYKVSFEDSLLRMRDCLRSSIA
jgi:hypothetical protein